MVSVNRVWSRRRAEEGGGGRRRRRELLYGNVQCSPESDPASGVGFKVLVPCMEEV